MDGPQVLLRAAWDVMRNAYAPYSGFKVGAAVRGRSGAIYAGANVEDSTYPQGQCAEASALGALVAGGETVITGVAVVAERLEFCPPCGGCRQRLSEFGESRTPVYLGRPGGALRAMTLGELLPGAFGREAAAIANPESRAGLARLADEQAALRRVATLVARGVPAEELFVVVTECRHHLCPALRQCQVQRVARSVAQPLDEQHHHRERDPEAHQRDVHRERQRLHLARLQQIVLVDRRKRGG
jgi:cytidine deaminase